MRYTTHVVGPDKKHDMKKLLLPLCFTLLCTAAMAANLQREQQIADQIVNNISQGEPIWLGKQASQYLALHLQPATHKTLGGVILLHDMDANPDAAHVIQPLRVGLAEQGWETLSIQLPLASQNAELTEHRSLFTEALPRIQSAVDFFTAKQNRNLILIGHGLGASMGLTFLAKTPAQEIRAFVAIGLAGGALQNKDPHLETISTLKIPMLDLFGSRDLESVIRNAKLRRSAAKRSGRTGYRQDSVTGAEHYFQGLEDNLKVRIGAWIRKAVAGMEIDGGEAANPPPSVP